MFFNLQQVNLSIVLWQCLKSRMVVFNYSIIKFAYVTIIKIILAKSSQMDELRINEIPAQSYMNKVVDTGEAKYLELLKYPNYHRNSKS